MPNDYELVRAARKNQGKQRVEFNQPGGNQDTYHDRVKISPKFGFSQDPPKMSDSERQKIMTGQVSTT